MRLFDCLDRHGTDDPDFNEGHPEDRCPLCTWPVRHHPGFGLPDADWAKWAHRRAAVVDIIFGWLG